MTDELRFEEGQELRHAGAPLPERMSALVDGELSAGEEQVVQQAVRESLPAQRELERLRRLRDGVARLVDVDRPDHLLPAILEAAASDASGSQRLSLRWTRRNVDDPHGRWALALGAGLALPSLLHVATGWTALLALPLVWLASVGVDRRWRARTVVLAGALGALGPLGLELSLGAGALAAPAAAVAVAVLQWRAAREANASVAGRLAAVLVLAALLARPDVIGWAALAAPAGGLLGGGLASLDRPRRMLPE